MAIFSHKNLRKPTPKKIKRIGNSMFLASQASAALALVGDMKWLAAFLVISGFVGKFLSECIGEDEPLPPNTP